jgi:hypothetical protein
MWEGLAKELEQKERANGLPTDGFLGSFAYLPTSSDSDTAPSNQVPSFPGGPADVPLSVATLSNNFFPNGLPRFTGDPPDHLSGPPVAAQSDPANRSILFQRAQSSFDLGADAPGDFGPDTRNLAEPGLPLSRSGDRFIPPPPPSQQEQAQYAAQFLVPGLDGLITDTSNRWSHLPVAALDVASFGLPFLKGAGLAAGVGGRFAGEGLAGLTAQEARALAESGQLITGPYGSVSGRLPSGWQAHHVNQNAVFRDIVPRKSGFSVGLRGNIFSEPGTPHYDFHRSMEDFWDQVRKGGSRRNETPTIAEYHQAAQRAFVAAGLPPEQASGLVAQAARDLTNRGVSLSAEVPRIPGGIWRLWRY